MKWGLGNDCSAYYYLNQNMPAQISAVASAAAAAPGATSGGSSKHNTPAKRSMSSENMNSNSNAGSNSGAHSLIDEGVHQRDKDLNQEQDVDGFAALKTSLQFLNIPADTTQHFFNAIAGEPVLPYVQ